MSGLIILGILLLAFWFILVRPQRSRAREQKQLIHDLEPGDEIDEEEPETPENAPDEPGEAPGEAAESRYPEEPVDRTS